jgi:hypothetical protein
MTRWSLSDSTKPWSYVFVMFVGIQKLKNGVGYSLCADDRLEVKIGNPNLY